MSYNINYPAYVTNTTSATAAVTTTGVYYVGCCITCGANPATMAVMHTGPTLLGWQFYCPTHMPRVVDVPDIRRAILVAEAQEAAKLAMAEANNYRAALKAMGVPDFMLDEIRKKSILQDS